MITLLKVRNYKSLENVELPLGPLHVLVGRNNSGKSNLFDVFQFLRELATLGHPAVHSRGGFAQLVWGGDIKRTISFEIHGRVQEQSKGENLVYHVEIAGGPQHYIITRERLSVLAQQEKAMPILAFPVDRGKALLTDSSGNKWEPNHPQNQLLLQQLLHNGERFGPLAKFAEDLFSWSLYNFEPSAMRKLNAVKQDFHFQPTGENFSSVIHSIQSEHGTQFSEIENLLKSALPEVRRLLTALTKEGQTYISLEEDAVPARIPAWAMSNGTLRLLGQLAALFSPEPPALACYEEPENYVHPGLQSLLADVFKNAAEKNQVLISTHSPYFVNCFSPQNLIIVEKKNGASQFKSVIKKKGLKDTLRVLGLGELWYSGELGGTP